METTSTQPYLLRALYEWCSDNGLTPHIAVRVDETVQVPREFVQNGQIVLNIGFDATNGLKMGNDYIEFKARFGGVPRDIFIPVNRVLAIYARETGQGGRQPEKLRGNAAPPTVYRALDFFVDIGVLHRAESLNGFVFCNHFDEQHTSVILNCTHCGKTEELAAQEPVDILLAFCRERGFEVQEGPLVLSGECRDCQQIV